MKLYFCISDFFSTSKNATNLFSFNTISKIVRIRTDTFASASDDKVSCLNHHVKLFFIVFQRQNRTIIVVSEKNVAFTKRVIVNL